MSEVEQIRLVTLGGQGVGKSCILKRFLFNQYSDKYKPTVEDLFSKEYHAGTTTLKVDFLDTAGDCEFPAMRRLSLATANAFLLVYAVDSHQSFVQLQAVFEEIREQRTDFQEIPIMIVGNKSDVGKIRREVEFDDICNWIHDQLPKLRGKAMECSAKENMNVKEIFSTFVKVHCNHLAEDKLATESEANDSSTSSGPFFKGIRRRSSAYAGRAKPPLAQSLNSSSLPVTSAPPPSTPVHSLQARQTFHSSNSSKSISSPSALSFTSFFSDDSSSCGFSRNKGRSRSLIRRTSKKAKQAIRDSSTGDGQCKVT